MTSVALEQAGRWGATQGYSVAAGNGEAGCRPARVNRPGNRGLAQLCHASKSGPELREWGRIMLGYPMGLLGFFTLHEAGSFLHFFLQCYVPCPHLPPQLPNLLQSTSQLPYFFLNELKASAVTATLKKSVGELGLTK